MDLYSVENRERGVGLERPKDTIRCHWERGLERKGRKKIQREGHKPQLRKWLDSLSEMTPRYGNERDDAGGSGGFG